MPPTTGWVSDVLARIPGVFEVGAALGYNVFQRGGGASLSPCPSCGAEKRGRHDPRGPVGFRPDNHGWHCHRCDASGTAIDLIAWRLCGARFKGLGDRNAEVREYCAGRGWCEPARSMSQDARGPITLAPPPAAPSAPAVVAHRPSAASLLEVWRIYERQPIRRVVMGARAVTDDVEVAAWLRSRGLDPSRVAALNLARAILPNAVLPGWAAWRGPWTATGHRVVVPLFDAAGTPASIHARTTDRACTNKALSPRGFAVAGLVMANAVARKVLTEGPNGPLSTPLIVEGVPDFLTWATRRPDLPIFAVISGSWSAELAARIPSASTVTIRTHADTAGDKYARAICATLAARCRVLRARAAQVVYREV